VYLGNCLFWDLAGEMARKNIKSNANETVQEQPHWAISSNFSFNLFEPAKLG